MIFDNTKNISLCTLIVIFLFLAGPIAASTPSIESQTLPAQPTINPKLKFPTLKAYESECGEAGIMLDSTYVRLFAPKRKSGEAKIIFKYLVKAYNELYKLVGMHTEYKMVVYHFPDKSEHAFGGTSNCTIWYSYENLELESKQEWKKFKIPHVSGYIEEMAHNFVHVSRAHFGWEMIGWTIGTKVTKKIAANPIHTKHVKATRDGQKETFQRYRKADYTFPEDLPANQCDRIHAYILWVCEKNYKAKFWPDFFAEIHKQRPELLAAASLGDGDKIRNKKYQITINCFDRLQGVNFKKILKKFEISLTTDVKSLHPTEPDWNRKFILDKARVKTNKSSKVPKVVDIENLPQLHKAAYGGYYSKAKELLGNDADVNTIDEQGNTPADLAKIKGHNGTAAFLHKKESKKN